MEWWIYNVKVKLVDVEKKDYAVRILALDWSIFFPKTIMTFRPIAYNMQTRHTFVWEIRIFSVKIYQSVSCTDVSRHFSRDSYRDVIWQKIVTLRNNNRWPAAKTRCFANETGTESRLLQNRSIMSHGATVGLGLRI